MYYLRERDSKRGIKIYLLLYFDVKMLIIMFIVVF